MTQHRTPRTRVGTLALASLVPLVSLVPASGAFAAPPPVRDEDRGDHLRVVVEHSGDPRVDGSRTLFCHPGHGSHPRVTEACAVLDRNTVWGRDPFAPVPDDSACTLQYGGPVTAHVTGWWAGRPVDAVFTRSDGCQIERWDRLVPLLPGPGERTLTSPS